MGQGLDLEELFAVGLQQPPAPIGIGTGEPSGQPSRFPGTVDRYADDAEKVLQQGAEQIDQVARQIDQAGVRVDGEALAQRIENELAGKLGQTPAGGAARRALQQYAGAFREMGQASFDELLQERRLLGKTLNATSDNPLAAFRDDLYRILSEELETAADFTEEGLSKAWRDANRKYYVGKTLADAAESQSLREASNRQFSPSDYFGVAVGGGLAGAATGMDPVSIAGGAAMSAAANKFVRGREHAIGAQLAETAGPAMQRAGERLGRQGARQTTARAAALGGAAGVTGQANETRAGQTAQRFRQVAQASPEALGEYQQPIMEAIESGDSAALSATLYDLAHRDERFRTEVMPRILGREPEQEDQ